MTGDLKFTKSVKVLPAHESVFQQVKPKRPCQVEPVIASIEIMASVPSTAQAKPEETIKAEIAEPRVSDVDKL